MDPLLDELKRDKAHEMVYVKVERPEAAERGCRISDLPLTPSVVKRLEGMGIREVYRFQEEAVRALSKGENVVICAPTGMGKTEAFLLPILNEAVSEPFQGPVALLVYPTKALARDQLKRIEVLTSTFYGVRAAVYDGDTPKEERRRIFEYPPSILITNPDMIHVSLLSSLKFRELLSKVKFVVLDDAHVYTGVFGSHVAYVVRRLKKYLPGEVRFVASSATIGNPAQLLRQLVGEEGRVVVERRGRRGEVIHVMLKPLSRSKFVECMHLLRKCLDNGIKTIIFADSHASVEYLGRLAAKCGLKVGVHRAGLRADEREAVEERFRGGELNAVIATPTLELGIDIGDVDCVILSNIPPTYTRYVQRTGRCGRRGGRAYVFTLLGNDPISSYYERYPEEFFKREYDPVVMDLENREVAKVHLLAMAAEGTLRLASLSPFELSVVRELERSGYLVRRGGRLRATKDGFRRLSRSRGLRGIGEVVKIIDERGKVVGFREMPAALRELHPGAIYLHAGRVYVVKEYKFPVVRVRGLPPDVDLVTSPLYYTSPTEFERRLSRDVLGLPVEYGGLKLTEVVYGYVVKEFGRGAPVKEETLKEPLEYAFHTKGVRLTLPVREEWGEWGNAAAVHAIEHAMIIGSETLVGASPSDLGGVSFPSGHIFIYDAYQGGSGLSRALLDRMEEVFKRAFRILRNCSCADGCPRCIYSPYCGNNNRVLSRRKALRLLEEVLRGEVREVKGEPEGKPLA